MLHGNSREMKYKIIVKHLICYNIIINHFVVCGYEKVGIGLKVVGGFCQKGLMKILKNW